MSSPAVFAPQGVLEEDFAHPQFTATNVNFFYGNFHALHDVSLKLPARKVTALIGPSGCGKSTFLRILNRMYETLRGTRLTGEVLLGRQRLLDYDSIVLRRKVGMVFQKPMPFPKSIYDNVAYGLRVNHIVPRDEVNARVEQSLRRAALWGEVKDRLHASALGLSGGQQQRLCIARALAIDPEVLLMDEPCSALDPIATAKIEELMVELKEDCTIITVTHNMLQAARVADYTGFFMAGRLVEFDASRVIFQRPAQRATEEYVTGRFG